MAETLLALVDDSHTETVVNKIRKRGDPQVNIVDSRAEALRLLAAERYDFFVADYNSLGEGALPLLKRLNRMTSLTDLIILAGGETIAGVTVDLVIDRTLPLSDICETIAEAFKVRRLLKRAGIFGHSENLRDAARLIEQVAATDISVLIIGPSGTGKELVARALHDNSPRRQGEYISINCASIPETLLESELFGHEKGAFTGADAKRIGLFALADRGTLLLDEIGEMQVSLQAKLLRALETKSFFPLGARKPVKVDVRVVTATNRNLQREVEEGRFRIDLYYRIGVVTITLKRLADRPEDILPIVARYLDRVKAKFVFSPEATNLLLKYSWPGNVRELANFLQRLLLTAPSGEISRDTVASLLDKYGSDDRTLPVVTNITPEQSGYRLIYQALLNLANEIVDMKRLLTERLGEVSNGRVEPVATTAGGELEVMEEKLIKDAVDRFGGNRKQAAAHLGIGERTLYRKLKKYDIS